MDRPSLRHEVAWALALKNVEFGFTIKHFPKLEKKGARCYSSLMALSQELTAFRGRELKYSWDDDRF